MTIIESPPIACTLSGSAFKERAAWMAALSRNALRSHRRDDLKLELRYLISARDDVREMVRNERRCCAFLDFEVQERSDDIVVTITAPESARDAADALFDQFLSGQTPPVACACSSAPKPNTETAQQVAGITAATLATGAAACAACCVLPFALPAAVLASAGGLIAVFEHAYRWMTSLATLVVIATWAWLAWQNMRGHRKPSASTVYIMFLASGIVAIAQLWPLIERPVIQALRN